MDSYARHLADDRVGHEMRDRRDRGRRRRDSHERARIGVSARAAQSNRPRGPVRARPSRLVGRCLRRRPARGGVQRAREHLQRVLERAHVEPEEPRAPAGSSARRPRPACGTKPQRAALMRWRAGRDGAPASAARPGSSTSRCAPATARPTRRRPAAARRQARRSRRRHARRRLLRRRDPRHDHARYVAGLSAAARARRGRRAGGSRRASGAGGGGTEQVGSSSASTATPLRSALRRVAATLCGSWSTASHRLPAEPRAPRSRAPRRRSRGRRTGRPARCSSSSSRHIARGRVRARAERARAPTRSPAPGARRRPAGRRASGPAAARRPPTRAAARRRAQRESGTSSSSRPSSRPPRSRRARRGAGSPSP